MICWGVLLLCFHVAHGGVRWTCQSLPRGMLVGPTCQVSIVVGPTWLRWTNRRLPCGTDMLRWPNEVLTRVTLSLFSDSVCVCLGSPVCTQMSLCPQVAPRVILIKSQPLINPFNLFYLLWIYFNSSTYPKIMKISSKIPKFMMIIPVIFNSILPLPLWIKNSFV
jgi:hypothetical protein